MSTVLMTAAAFSLLLIPKNVSAAVLYFSPSGGEERVGDIFTVDAKIDLESGEECVNVIEGTIGFDQNFLEAVDFSVGDSVLSLWLALPKAADMPEVNRLARLTFSGGTPGGYCGKIPGDPGTSNIIGKLIFKVKQYRPQIAADSHAKVFFLDTAKVLMNDGLGTAAGVTRKDADFFIADKGDVPKQEWENILTADKTPPEPFILEIQQNPELYNGKYYLVFSTVDKQSGIDHYSVQEIKKPAAGEPGFWSKLYTAVFGAKTFLPEWRPAATPYVLSDQSLGSIIRVRAVDKAGNERITEYFPKEATRTRTDIFKFLPLVLLLIVLVLALGLYLSRKAKIKQQAK